MSGQLDLLTGKPAVAPVRPLTERQQTVLDLVTEAGIDGIRATQVGLALHVAAGKHPPDDPCQWCGEDGKSVLRALQKRRLVVRRRTGRWTVPKPKAVSAAKDTGALPAGF